MTATIIDGKKLAETVRSELTHEVSALKDRGVQPGLAVVLVGDDPASAVYVRNKTKACRAVGIAHFDYFLSPDTSQSTLLSLIIELNRRDDVHGILVQLPLPSQIDSVSILRSVDPAKDVDGFHPYNAGRLMNGDPLFVPCTPLGIMRMLREVEPSFKGAEAVVIGRSMIVGKPMAQLLTLEHATVTLCHSHTRDVRSHVERADIVVAAIGRPAFVSGDWIKPGAIVIDVGINRVGEKLVGDVDFQHAITRARAMTPVPGGVGPMTIAMLLANTVKAALRHTKASYCL